MNVGVLVSTGRETRTIAIAEGAETALSISDANPELRVYAVLGSGNFTRVAYSQRHRKSTILRG